MLLLSILKRWLAACLACDQVTMSIFSLNEQSLEELASGKGFVSCSAKHKAICAAVLHIWKIKATSKRLSCSGNKCWHPSMYHLMIDGAGCQDSPYGWVRKFGVLFWWGRGGCQGIPESSSFLAPLGSKQLQHQGSQLLAWVGKRLRTWVPSEILLPPTVVVVVEGGGERVRRR